MSGKEVVIDVQNLTKRYGEVAAVDDVNFQVKPGEIVGFVGLNGAGKSTTINLLLGFINANSGKVKLFDEVVAPANAADSHQDIGFATGDMALFDKMTGRQYHDFIAKSFRRPIDKTVYDSLCDRFQPELTKPIRQLSRGNRQKVALIAAFMTDPKLVILDEPSSGLDPVMQQAFRDLLREHQNLGTTVFMSSHYLSEVREVCSRILVIRDGKIIKDIEADELASTGGKLIRLVTESQCSLPEGSKLVQAEQLDKGFVTEFVTSLNMAELQKWLGSIAGLRDISIADSTIETAFHDLYNAPGVDDVSNF
ncbi:hypothetical protein B7Y94_00195 [Candidatus Saccharibacteria bacterium 32-49-12]|nr:MAG: hypothetical protein B7Y94_00195 [Candidatus Saccharibacteria bacterium 32-49-12]